MGLRHRSASVIVLLGTISSAPSVVAADEAPVSNVAATLASNVMSGLSSTNEGEQYAAGQRIRLVYATLERRLIEQVTAEGVSREKWDDCCAILADLRSPYALEWLLVNVDLYKPKDWGSAQDTSLRDYPNARKLVEYKEAATGAIVNFISVRDPEGLPDRHLRFFAHVILHVEGYAEKDRDRIIAYIENKPLDGPHREDVAKLISLLKTVKIREPVVPVNVDD